MVDVKTKIPLCRIWNVYGFSTIVPCFLNHSSSSGVPLVRRTDYDGGRLDVELLSEVFDALLPSSLVEDAEDAAGPPPVLQSPGPQGREQWL